MRLHLEGASPPASGSLVAARADDDEQRPVAAADRPPIGRALLHGA
jgi:hypothetical protein